MHWIPSAYSSYNLRLVASDQQIPINFIIIVVVILVVAVSRSVHIIQSSSWWHVSKTVNSLQAGNWLSPLVMILSQILIPTLWDEQHFLNSTGETPRHSITALGSHSWQETSLGFELFSSWFHSFIFILLWQYSHKTIDPPVSQSFIQSARDVWILLQYH